MRKKQITKKIASIGLSISLALNSCSNIQKIQTEKKFPKNQITKKENFSENPKETLENKLQSPNIIPKNFDFYFHDTLINIDLYEGSKKLGENIIVLPTLGEPVSSIKEFCKNLAIKKFNVFALDFPGFGKSRGKRGVIKIKEYFEVLEETTKKINKNYNNKIGIIGSGFGGDIAGMYLLSKPNKIKSAILEGIVFPFEKNLVLKNINDEDIKYVVKNNDKWGPWLKYGNYFNILEKAKKQNETFYLNQKLNTQFKNPEYVLEIELPYYLKFLRYPINPDYSKLPPTLFIGLPDDTIVPLKHIRDIYKKAKKQNKNVKFSIIKNSKLLVLDEQPEKIAEVAYEWFKKTLH